MFTKTGRLLFLIMVSEVAFPKSFQQTLPSVEKVTVQKIEGA